MKIALSDLKPGYYGGMPPGNWWERWLCHAEGCKTFHWMWLVRTVYEEGMLVDFISSESISKGTSITRVENRKMMVWRIIGDPAIDADDMFDIHSNFGGSRYSWGMSIWSGVWYLAKHYFQKVVPFIKFKGVNCLYWVDIASLLLGYDLVPGDPEYIMQVDLENSPTLEYVGELN